MGQGLPKCLEFLPQIIVVNWCWILWLYAAKVFFVLEESPLAHLKQH